MAEREGLTRRYAPRPSGAVAKELWRHPSPPMYSERPPETDVPNIIVLPIGGEGGIRTLDGLLTHTPLAGARLRPLGHLSGQDIALIAERRMIPARSSPGKAKGSNRLGQGFLNVIDDLGDRSSRA